MQKCRAQKITSISCLLPDIKDRTRDRNLAIITDNQNLVKRRKKKKRKEDFNVFAIFQEKGSTKTSKSNNIYAKPKADFNSLGYLRHYNIQKNIKIE